MGAHLFSLDPKKQMRKFKFWPVRMHCPSLETIIESVCQPSSNSFSIKTNILVYLTQKAYLRKSKKWYRKNIL
jgi:hypothetical protein